MRPSGPFAAGWRRPEAAPRQIPASSGPSVTWRAHLTQKITLQQLATQAGLSREYFCTLFHQQTGKTVFAYLRWARIQLAKEMLAATENSLAAIASLLGFSSQSHFQRAFREVEGCTPFLYRRRAWREQGSLF